VSNDVFTPNSLTVTAGTAVTWAWNSCNSDVYGGQTCVTHSVVFDDGAQGSGLKSSGTFVHTFATAGTYTYHCGVHGAAMTGKVIVQ
jgi:plastocyanin